MKKSYLTHHGIKGQKWGVRRYQEEDGSLTKAGKQKLKQDLNKMNNTALKTTLKPGGSMQENYMVERAIVNRAQKYVIKKNMTLDVALAKSRQKQRTNAMIFLGGMLAASVATIAVANNTLSEI